MIPFENADPSNLLSQIEKLIDRIAPPERGVIILVASLAMYVTLSTRSAGWRQRPTGIWDVVAGKYTMSVVMTSVQGAGTNEEFCFVFVGDAVGLLIFDASSFSPI